MKQLLVVWSLALLVSATPAFATSMMSETEFTFKGQLRLRPESRDNADFNSGTDDKKAFVGSRTRLAIGAKVSEDAIAKVILQDSRQFGSESQVATGTEKEAVDIFEAYFQINNILDLPIAIKAGRQTLVYGDQRLLGHLGWKDEGRTHDAVKLMLGSGALKLDLFASKEVESGKPADSSHDDDLLGAYAMFKPMDGLVVDLYALNWKTSGSAEVDGATVAVKGKDIMTYGARVAGKSGAFDYTGEYVMQSGDWAKGVSQEAYAYAVKAGYRIEQLKTRFGVEYDYGSGDDDTSDSTHKAFVFPFHTNHAQYGYMDYFSWGNMTDLRFSVVTSPIDKLTLKLDYHIFSLAEGADDWLNVVGTKTFKGAVDGSTSTDAGTEIDFTAVFKSSKQLKLVGGYSIFNPGDAAKERTGGNSDVSTWAYLMTIFNF